MLHARRPSGHKLDTWEQVLRGDAGGDALLTICLWKAGYAHTDPGFSFFHPTVRMFDPGPEDSPGLLYAMTEALGGRCDPSCQVRLTPLLIKSFDTSLCCIAFHKTAQVCRMPWHHIFN